MTRKSSMTLIEDAYNQTRSELAEIGLLSRGKYLDRIRCVQAGLPSWANHGYFFDEGVGFWAGLLGYEPGTIYIPSNAPHHPRQPGGTMRDILRHEFAHAWAWLDRRFIDGAWFKQAFGAHYGEDWEEHPEPDSDEFFSDYAATSPKEDFAETFMAFMRYRNSLDRFRHRPGLQRKIRAVRRAVRRAARERAPRIAGPRL